MEQTEITITPEMIEAAEKAYRTKLLSSKRIEEWMAEMPADMPFRARRFQACRLHEAAWRRDQSAALRFYHVCPSPELRQELLDMVAREQAP